MSNNEQKLARMSQNLTNTEPNEKNRNKTTRDTKNQSEQPSKTNKRTQTKVLKNGQNCTTLNFIVSNGFHNNRIACYASSQ